MSGVLPLNTGSLGVACSPRPRAVGGEATHHMGTHELGYDLGIVHIPCR
jgi:hypothetical protein